MIVDAEYEYLGGGQPVHFPMPNMEVSAHPGLGYSQEDPHTNNESAEDKASNALKLVDT